MSGLGGAGSGIQFSLFGFDVYALDYGCYVELLTTAKAPEGLFEAEGGEGEVAYVEVPADDYRSIRRAILDLSEFERAEIAAAQ